MKVQKFREIVISFFYKFYFIIINSQKNIKIDNILIFNKESEKDIN